VAADEPGHTRIYDDSPRLAPLFVKATLPAVPGLSRLPGLRRHGREAPDLAVVREGVEIDRERLAAYVETCDFVLGDDLPATYPHVLAFPLQMALMTDGSFPFAAIGAIHAANVIAQHRPLRVGEPFDLSVQATALRSHAKGRLIDLVTEATADGEVVWRETTTVLRPGRGDADAPETLPLRDVDVPVGPARWLLSGGLGRRYAGVSGDRNPIHLYPLTARAFGFARPIVHGMWTKARCLAALRPRLPDAYTVEVAFRRPIALPGSVRFGSRDEDGRIVFGVTGARDAAPHLVGLIHWR
jgi:acyl dehydratase